jgi:hypothetical protein
VTQRWRMTLEDGTTAEGEWPNLAETLVAALGTERALDLASELSVLATREAAWPRRVDWDPMKGPSLAASELPGATVRLGDGTVRAVSDNPEGMWLRAPNAGNGKTTHRLTGDDLADLAEDDPRRPKRGYDLAVGTSTLSLSGPRAMTAERVVDALGPERAERLATQVLEVVYDREGEPVRTDDQGNVLVTEGSGLDRWLGAVGDLRAVVREALSTYTDWDEIPLISPDGLASHVAVALDRAERGR